MQSKVYFRDDRPQTEEMNPIIPKLAPAGLEFRERPYSLTLFA